MEAFQGNDLAITRESLYGTFSEPTYAGVTSFMRLAALASGSHD